MNYVILCFLLLSLNIYAQEELFSEAIIESKILEKDHFEMNLEANYKHAYQKSRWRRVGFDVRFHQELNSNWSLVSNIQNNYRFDSQLENFYELRPSLGIQLKTKILENFHLSQRLLGEWRNFFSSQFENYLRSRYKIQLNYTIFSSNKPDNNWSFETAFEWYFLRNSIFNERYSNSREFSFFATKKINDFKFGLGYIREVFFSKSEEFGSVGNTISVRINF